MGIVPFVGHDEPYDETLRCELSVWRAETTRRGLRELPEAAWRIATATLSLLRPVTPGEARDMLSRLSEASTVPDAEGYARLLFEMFSRSAGEYALRPEPIVEHLIITIFMDGESCEDPEKLLDWALLEPPGAPGPDGTECSMPGTGQTDARDARDEQVCNAIAWCTSREAAAMVRLACSVLRHRPYLWVVALDVTQRQEGPFTTVLEEALKSGEDLPAIMVLTTVWPGDPVLRGVAVAIPARVLETGRESMNLLGISTYLADVGDHVGALEIVRKAIRIHHESADEDSADQGLTLPLANLISRLRDVGNHAGTLNVEREVVGIHYRLIEEFRVFSGSHLAVSLACWSARLVGTGSSAQAVEVLREAVRIHRETVEVYRGLSDELHRGFGPFLAVPLSVLAAQSAELRDSLEALIAAREIVDLRHEAVGETAVRGDDVPACATNTPFHAGAGWGSRDALPDKESRYIEHREFIYIEVLLVLTAVSPTERVHDIAENPGKTHEVVRGFIGEANVSTILCVLCLRPGLADHVPYDRFAAAFHAYLTGAPGETECHLSGIDDHVALDSLDIFRRCVETLWVEPIYTDRFRPVRGWVDKAISETG